jgi:hypothetical protein
MLLAQITVTRDPVAGSEPALARWHMARDILPDGDAAGPGSR